MVFERVWSVVWVLQLLFCMHKYARSGPRTRVGLQKCTNACILLIGHMSVLQSSLPGHAKYLLSAFRRGQSNLFDETVVDSYWYWFSLIYCEGHFTYGRSSTSANIFLIICQLLPRLGFLWCFLSLSKPRCFDWVTTASFHILSN